MVNNVYVIFNVLSCRYGDVCAYPSDQFALARLQPVLSRQGSLSEFQLCKVGTIDVENGMLLSFAPVRIPWKSPSLDLPQPNEEEKSEKSEKSLTV